MPDHTPSDLPEDVLAALLAIRRSDTLLRHRQARDQLTDALAHCPEHAHLLRDADAELQRRLTAIETWRPTG